MILQISKTLRHVLQAQIQHNLWCLQFTGVLPDRVLQRLACDLLALSLGSNIRIGQLEDFIVHDDGYVFLEVESTEDLNLTWQELLMHDKFRFDLYFINGDCPSTLFANSRKSEESDIDKISMQTNKAPGIRFTEVQSIAWEKTLTVIANMKEHNRL